MLSLGYPILVGLFTFFFLGLKDDSYENYIEYVKTAAALGLCGANFGLMWGTLFKNDNNATISSIVFVLLSSLGAG